jgi:prevent-host-death family protein
MHIDVGSYEAKTRLSELLRGVQAGHRYTITLRGEAVADLLPVQDKKPHDAVAAVHQMRDFMRSSIHISEVDLEALIKEEQV